MVAGTHPRELDSRATLEALATRAQTLASPTATAVGTLAERLEERVEKLLGKEPQHGVRAGSRRSRSRCGFRPTGGACARVAFHPRCHLDGARFWQCAPFYERPLDELAGLFDTRLGRLDVVQRVQGIDSFDELRANAVEQQIPEIGHAILVAGLDDLIAMKEEAGRDQAQAVGVSEATTR